MYRPGARTDHRQGRHGGGELGDAMDEFAKLRGVKRKMGAIGVLTKGLFDRSKSYEFIFALAAARFLWQDKYGK